MKFSKNFTVKWKKKNLFYEKSQSNIILIENTKLYLFCWVCVYI